jgi:hypothetical protein
VAKRRLPYPVVHVRWLDSSVTVGECGAGDLPEPVEIDTVGWLVRRTPQALTVAQEWHAADGMHRLVISIPAFAVRAVRRLA